MHRCKKRVPLLKHVSTNVWYTVRKGCRVMHGFNFRRCESFPGSRTGVFSLCNGIWVWGAMLGLCVVYESSEQEITKSTEGVGPYNLLLSRSSLPPHSSCRLCTWHLDECSLRLVAAVEKFVLQSFHSVWWRSPSVAPLLPIYDHSSYWLEGLGFWAWSKTQWSLQ